MPEQDGSGPTTGPEIARVVPQEFVTVGGVGTTCAFEIHATVELPGPGIENVGGEIVYVCIHWPVVPVQSVYVHV